MLGFLPNLSSSAVNFARTRASSSFHCSPNCFSIRTPSWTISAAPAASRSERKRAEVDQEPTDNDSCQT